MLRVRRLPTIALALALFACRGSRGEDQQAAASAEASPSGAGLRGAAALSGVRALELPEGGIGGAAPRLASTSDALMLAWLSDTGEPTLKLANLGEDGDEPLEPQTITASPRLLVNWADVPAIGETPGGRLVLAWPEYHTDDPSVGYGLRVAALLDDGSVAPAWSPDEVRRGAESGFAEFVTTTAGLRLIWLDGRDLHGPGHGDHGRGTMTLRSVLIDEDGRQQGPSIVLDERTCECCKLGVGLLGEQAFAAYRDRSEAEVRDTFVAGPGLSPTPVAADGWTIAGCPVNGPAVAVAGGRAHVAWYTGAADRSASFIARATALASFAAPVRFDLGLPGGRVDLLALPDGDVLISWLELDPANPGLAALLTRRLRADGSLGPPWFVVELGAARDWGFPKAALRGDEVVWVYTDPTAADGRPRLQARVAGLPS